jgi:hypothetical protein
MKQQVEPWIFLNHGTRVTTTVAPAASHTVLVAATAGRRIRVLELEYVAMADPAETGTAIAELEAGAGNTVLHRWGFTATKVDNTATSSTPQSQARENHYSYNHGISLAAGDALKISNTGDKHTLLVNVVYDLGPE